MTAGRREGGTTVRATVTVPVSLVSAERLADAVIRAEKGDVGDVSITFVGPARMRRLNREHLGHDRVTDVLAFALTAVPPYRRAADIYICPAAAARNAKRFGTTVRDETRRLIVHGVLHVLGYQHPETDDRTRSAMWRVQERHLAALPRRAP